MGGQLIGNRYRVLRKIGEGGMAVVHLAVDEKLGRDIAIKILRERYEHHEEIRTRFQHEARAISSFDHPNILKIYDFSGEDSRQLWIVTELIHGRNLAQILETTPSGWLHPAIAASIVREICRALASAHEHGVVHRDVKPENVMITHHGTVKLMDFGIAKIQRITNMTQTGIFMGSPSYMSPEQVRGRDVDNRSDIYSLGVLFYELVTGKLPFTGSSTADIAMRILNGDFAHPRFVMAGIPDSLDHCIVSCMALSPENRPQSIEHVGEQIDAVLQSMGLENSMRELERCFKDPKAYGDRLAKILKVSEIKHEPTVLINQNQHAQLGRSNNEAINSPIPRPDVAQNTSLAHAPRRDHLLPPRSVPHFTKRQLTPELISAHLPERRNQQRTIAATRIASGSKFGQYQAKAAVNQTPSAREAPRPKPSQNHDHSYSGATPQQHHRENRSVSRMVPPVPKRLPRQVKYVVRETHYQQSGFGAFAKFVLATLLLSIAALLWLGEPGQWIDRNKLIAFDEKIKKNMPKNTGKRPNESVTTKTENTKKTLSQTGQDKQAAETSQTSKSLKIEPLPKFAEKIQDTKPSTLDKKQNHDVTDPAKNKIRDTGTAKQRPGSNKNTSESKFRTTSEPKTSIVQPIQSIKSTNSQVGTVAPEAISDTKNNKRASRQEIDSSKLSTTSESKDNMTAVHSTQTKTAPKPAERPKDSKRVQISVSSTPAAELFVNGRRHGTTNNNGTSSDWIDVDSGLNKIELRRAGFSTKVETINVSSGDRQRFGPFVLNRSTSATPAASLYKLTLATNMPPVEVTVINLDTNAKQSLTLSQSTKIIQLERGIYEVTMKRKSDIRKRRIDFSGGLQQLTFSVDFKDESN